MSELFGSSPSISTVNPGTHSTLDQSQSSIQGILAELLGGGSNFTNNYSGQLSAGLTPQQLSTIGQFTNSGAGAASNAATGQAGYNTAESTLTGIANSTPASFQNYFQNSVVAPNETVFNTQTLPSLERAFAGSAGGNSSSDYGTALNTATTQLDQTLSGAASNAALTEYNTNQTNKLNAASMLASNSQLPYQQLESILNAQGQVQSTNQAADTAAEGFAQQAVGNQQSYASILESFLGVPTTASNSVVAQQGQQGALGSILSGLGSIFQTPGNGGSSAASGIGTAISSIFDFLS